MRTHPNVTVWDTLKNELKELHDRSLYLKSPVKLSNITYDMRARHYLFKELSLAGILDLEYFTVAPEYKMIAISTKIAQYVRCMIKKLFLISFFFGLTFYSHADEFDLKGELASPFTTDAKYVLASGAALTLALVVFKKQIVDPIQKKETEEKRLGKYSLYFDYIGRGIPNFLYFSYMEGAYLFSKDKADSERANFILKTTLYSCALVNVMKYTIREPRPSNSHERNSFPSGHTAMAFSFASTVAENHSRIYGTLAYLLASGVGYSRIQDNRHYLHDVVAGATIAISYGVALSQRQKQAQKATSLFQLLPTEDLKGAQFLYAHLF